MLEIGESRYVRHFGDPALIEQIDVIDVESGNPEVTLAGDLTDPGSLPTDAFDCVICTQTLLLIHDVSAAIATLERSLKRGGTVLITVPGISQICRSQSAAWTDQWRFTPDSLRQLLADAFGPAAVEIEAFGNVHVAAAFLYGLAIEDVRPSRREVHDRDYPLVIGAAAVKR